MKTLTATDPHPVNQANRENWDAKYRNGPTPWDTRITPPEVQAFWRTHWQTHAARQTLRAVDLGCGSGTNAAYLAALGVRVTGFELSGIALAAANAHHVDAQAGGRLDFVQADVTNLPIFAAQADYILDIGCLHGLPPERRAAYAQSVKANLREGGYYHLYAFDRSLTDDDVRGLAPGELESLFIPALTVVEAVAARPDRRPCHWYLLRKPEVQP